MGDLVYFRDYKTKAEKDQGLLRTREDAVDELARQLAAALPEYDLSYSLIDHAKQGGPVSSMGVPAMSRERIIEICQRATELSSGPSIRQGAPLTCQNGETLTVEMPADCPA